jgi:hypothetical protein
MPGKQEKADKSHRREKEKNLDKSSGIEPESAPE